MKWMNRMGVIATMVAVSAAVAHAQGQYPQNSSTNKNKKEKSTVTQQERSTQAPPPGSSEGMNDYIQKQKGSVDSTQLTSGPLNQGSSGMNAQGKSRASQGNEEDALRGDENPAGRLEQNTTDPAKPSGNPNNRSLSRKSADHSGGGAGGGELAPAGGSAGGSVNGTQSGGNGNASGQGGTGSGSSAAPGTSGASAVGGSEANNGSNDEQASSTQGNGGGMSNSNSSAEPANTEAVEQNTTSISGSPAVMSAEDGHERDGTNTVQRARPNMAGAEVDRSIRTSKPADEDEEIRGGGVKQQRQAQPNEVSKRNPKNNGNEQPNKNTRPLAPGVPADAVQQSPTGTANGTNPSTADQNSTTGSQPVISSDTNREPQTRAERRAARKEKRKNRRNRD